MNHLCLDHSDLAGLSARPLHGVELDFVDDLDAMIVALARADGAEVWRFAPLIAMSTLQRAGYCDSFPQHVTVPVPMTQSREAAVDCAHQPHALAPAACLPLYDAIAGTDRDGRLLITTSNTCWRHERHYAVHRRQWAFTMREVVCIGTDGDVRSFLNAWRGHLATIARLLGLNVSLMAASDPFFGPGDTKAFYQTLAGAKTELTVGDDLAIASLNNHRHHFANAFDIRVAGNTASTGCVAFGLDRWLAAMNERHGTDAAAWPAVPGPQQVLEA
ncbi:MAG: hypothetical protein AAF563_14750 [Pseudomonadota bacterium]